MEYGECWERDNPILKEGDIVSVPYIEENKQQIYDTFKKIPVIVTGFVMEPGAINFFPGYFFSCFTKSKKHCSLLFLFSDNT